MQRYFPPLFLLMLGCVLLINLLQASGTQLLFDESYYWYYAQHLDWGYFDHPPMIAWMIALGGLLSEGELGVRLISCLMGAGTLAILWTLVEHPGKREYTLQITTWFLSIVLMHAYGFLSLPDTPLLFFIALFLLAYRKFLQDPGSWTAMWLGAAMAALMYSKYHAALVIVCTLLTNRSLLKNRFAWMALGISLLAYAPHLHWLYENDFISVRYHISERPNQPYSFSKFTLGYLVNLLALFGFTFPWVYRGLARFRPSDTFQRALWGIAWGVLVFFFISSFQRRVQTQWLIAACIPIAVIIGNQLAASSVLRRWLYPAALVNLAILLFLRLGLVFPSLFPVHFETHGNREWVASAKALAGDADVVFENSYRLASMYYFYSGVPSLSINNVFYRKNQYSIDASEDRFQGKKVFFVRKGPRKTAHYFLNAKGEKRYGEFVDSLVTFRKLESGIHAIGSLQAGQAASFWVYNPYPHPVPLAELKYGLAYLDDFKRNQEVSVLRPVIPEADRRVLQAGDSLHFGLRLPEAKEGKPEYLRAVLRTGQMPWGLNGAAQKMDP